MASKDSRYYSRQRQRLLYDIIDTKWMCDTLSDDEFEFPLADEPNGINEEIIPSNDIVNEKPEEIWVNFNIETNIQLTE